MKPKQTSSLLLLLFLTFLLAGCSTPKELEYRDFKNFSIQKLGFAATNVRMDLVYYNPNNFGLQLKQADLDIYINNYYLGHTLQEYQVTIPRKLDFNLPITMEVDMKNLLKNGLTVFFNKEVMLKVVGKIKVGKANVFMSIPVNYEGKETFTLF
ncbi:MAG: LEA type 2 family protein [Ferruginibacter sp.]